MRRGFRGNLFAEHFHRGRAAGWAITVHAGEAAGAESVRQAVRELGAGRIGHCVRAAEDPALVDFLTERGIGLEISLTSSVHTSTVANYAHHPLRAYLERGLLATINTDDPATSGITLPGKLKVATPAAGLSPDQVRQAQANAIAFLSEGEREAVRAKAV